VALDEGADPSQVDVTVEIGKAQANEGGLAGADGGGESAVILLHSTAGTVKEALEALNRDTSRTLWLCHNQVIIVGSALAERGIADKIDFFMRDHEYTYGSSDLGGGGARGRRPDGENGPRTHLRVVPLAPH
jgi:hypothetical protein